MSLLPRTLFGRNVLLILALIAFGQLTSLLLLREFVQKPRINQLAVIAVRQINSMTAVLQTLSIDQRAALIASVNQQPTDNGPALRITAEMPPASNPSLPKDLLMLQFAAQVATRLQRNADDIHWSDNNATLWVPIRISAQTYWIGLHGMQSEGELGRVWLGVSLFSALLAICGALLIQRRINRPLQNLVAAVTQIAKGETPAPLAENAPTEIATVSRSFNHMSANLAQMDRERVIMLAGVSHDLRTPLAKLRLAIEILSKYGEAEVIANMTRSTAQMDAIIDQFLDYARAGSSEELAFINVNDLARDCAATYAAQGHAFTLKLDERVASFPLRPQAMAQLLTNLVENALRYGKPEFVLHTVKTASHVYLNLIDHGPGIPTNDVDAMKQAFTRGGATRGGTPGAGLGLAIVNRIAQLHGGQLMLLPAEGGGLHAQVSLPIAG